jgi:hypothetical protein
MKKLVLMVATHGFALAAGFALGVYLLPILTAPEGPAAADVESIVAEAKFIAVDVAAYDTVVVWCEAFSQFISAAKYR